jgi:hypothetical protein
MHLSEPVAFEELLTVLAGLEQRINGTASDKRP